MLRELLDRFAYRYRLWLGESQGDKVGAGIAPPEISPKSEPAWRLILRILWMLVCGLVLLAWLGRTAAHAFPDLSDGITMIAIFLAIIWCGVALFMLAGELLTKRTESDGDGKSI
jgi:hypothetical protein